MNGAPTQVATSTATEFTINVEPEISHPATVVICSMLRELLTLPEYNMTRIASEIGTSVATVRRLLQGNTLSPSIRTFDKIVRLYCSACEKLQKVSSP
jgi:hypothetical protein